MPHPLVRQNPAWTNSALLRQWDDIERLVGRAHMPKVTKHTANKLIAKEYGTGAYGTVMPTNTKGIVVKVTSDPSEAKFAYVLQLLGKYPQGIVKYHEVFRLHGSHNSRPVFVLWREEAYDVGESLPEESEYMLEEMRQKLDPAFRLTYSPELKERHLKPIKSAVQTYRKRTGYEHGGSGPNMIDGFWVWVQGEDVRAGFDVDAGRAVADDMAHSGNGRLVGAAIRDMIDQDLVLADVHAGNVGRVKRNGQFRTVITDPGNVTELTHKFDKYKVPTVEEAIGSRKTAAR